VVEDRVPGEWMDGTGVFDWEEWVRSVEKKKRNEKGNGVVV